MSYACNFCNNSFKTKSSLIFHQNNAKFCLQLQDRAKISKKFQCEFCHKILSTKYNMELHVKKCNQNNQYIIKLKQEICNLTLDNSSFNDDIILLSENNINLMNHNDELQLLNHNLQNDNLLLKTHNQNQTNNISYCKNQIQELNQDYRNQIQELHKDYKNQILDIHKDYKNQIQELQNKLERLAIKAIDRPTTNNSTTNTINNNKISLNVLPSQNEIDQKIELKFNDSYLWSGIKGIAQFAYDHIITLEDGTIAYACFDASRQSFKYKNKDGIEIKDPKALKFTKMIKPGLIKQTKILLNFFNQECENYEYKIQKGLEYDKNQYNTINSLKEKALEVGIDLLDIENSKFSTELATLSCL